MVETTICPGKVLEDGEAHEVLKWFLLSSRFDGMTGQPNGPPEWPFPGGMLHQPAKLVDAAEFVREEWGRWAESARLARAKKKDGRR